MQYATVELLRSTYFIGPIQATHIPRDKPILQN